MKRKWKPDIQEPPPARACAVVSYGGILPEAVKKDLASLFGKPDYETREIVPGNAPYGPGFAAAGRSRIYSFQRPMGREELVDMKKKTVSLEAYYQKDGAPALFVEPLYLTEHNLVRGVLGDDPGRVYLYGGVYGQVLLRYDSYTYRSIGDAPSFYQMDEVITSFNDIRLIYLSEIRS